MAEILLIDDDPDMHKIVTFFLRTVGHTVSCIDNARDGLERMRERHFDLVLLDVSMPGMDGLDAFKLFRHELGHQAPPVVFLTIHDSENLVFELHTEGCLGLIKKPVTSLRLQNEVNAAITALQFGRPKKKAGASAPASRTIY